MVIGGIRPSSLIPSIYLARKTFDKNPQNILPSDYEDINVSAKVVKIIQSYTEIVNKVTWHKY
jgi:UDP-N-acetylglucosamine 2-epimerase (non-hydrolysing)